MPELSLVIPFYNEEVNAERTVNDLRTSLSGVDYELLLVDNGSKDTTNAILSKLKSQSPANTTVVVVPVNQGYGNGILAGLAQAKGRFVGYAWGDGQVPGRDVRKVFDAIAVGGVDLAKVTRSKRNDGPVRMVQSVGYNLLFAMLFGVNSSDINGCPKIMRREVLAAVAPTAKDWWIDAQVMIGAAKGRYKIVEIPIEFLPRSGGKSNVGMGTVFEFMANMVRAKLGR